MKKMYIYCSERFWSGKNVLRDDFFGLFGYTRCQTNHLKRKHTTLPQIAGLGLSISVTSMENNGRSQPIVKQIIILLYVHVMYQVE